MDTLLLTTILLVVFGTVHFGLAVIVVLRRTPVTWEVRLAVAYILATGLWQWVLAFGRWVPALRGAGLAFFSAALLILTATAFLALTHMFLRKPSIHWGWWAAAALGFTVVILLSAGFMLVPASLAVDPSAVALAAAGVVWAAMIGRAGWITVAAYRATTQPLHRNRLTYWLALVGAALAADLPFFVGREDVGAVLRLGQLVLLGYTVANHRLPDVRQIGRMFLAYLVVGAVAAGLYVFTITALERSLISTFGVHELAAYAITFLVVAVFLHPLIQVIQNFTLERVSGIAYDTAQAVGDYSASISNILDITRLAEKVTTLLRQTMSARDARLYLVDNTHNGGQGVRLRPVLINGQPAAPDGTLSAGNPVTTYLAGEARPLAQYDIDLLPRYRNMPAEERAWLAALNADMFVPIHSRGQWIGLLTLGPKTNKDRYFNDDMQLLDTLADQTAIALENARLVSDLIVLNRDLKRAFGDLEKAHHQLNELDRLKSAFIGAITHELRTPVANIQFSIQLIEKYGLDKMLPEQQEQMYQLISAATHAKTMVDNLVNFATFLGKQGELKLAEFSFSELLGETVVMLEPHARRKDITLRTDVADEGLPAISGDRARVGDAVYHLMHNAIKFTQVEGAVTARAWSKDGYLHFEVTDNGVGIPPDKLGGLWEGFEQMADPLKRGLEGLGLGLALVKYVVTAHDGAVRAESSGLAGEGSTFGFNIPIGGPRPLSTLPVEELKKEAA